MNNLVIDNFAGGGGASTGIEAALGRKVDVAINHDEAAIAVHAANHPDTKHYCQSIYSVDPLDATGGQPVLLAWFSPDCKHHSKAKGGKPREKYIRDMAHVVPHWIERLIKATPNGRGAPQVIMLENVEEFRQWGPLDAEGKPIAERKGEEFDLWVRRIRRAGYKVEWRELPACDWGTPTSRKRLFLIARRDGLPIVWPEPTHGAPDSPAVQNGERLAWRTAAECIDWTLPCPSIFDRKRPLKDNTCKRIAAGVMRYVVNAARPFIIPVTHAGGAGRVYDPGDPLPTVTGAHRGEMAAVDLTIAPLITYAQQGGMNRPINAPMHTVTASRKDQNCIAAASLIKLRRNSHGEDPKAPLGTVNAGGQHHGIVAATLVRQFGRSTAADIAKPAPTITAGGGGKTELLSAFMAQHNTERGARANPGKAMNEPMSTITGRGTQQQPVMVTLIERGSLPDALLKRAEMTAAFLVKYYGTDQAPQIDAPLDTVTTRDRFAVVTVTIDTATFVLVDIGMRMLTPRELANAQGFPADYILDPECWYRTDRGNLKFGRLPKSHQIAKIGNAVCPPMSEALVRANLIKKSYKAEAA